MPWCDKVNFIHQSFLFPPEQRSIVRVMTVAYSASHPTLYLVSPWWNRLGSVLFGPCRTGVAFPWTRYRVGGLSEYATVMTLRIDLCTWVAPWPRRPRRAWWWWHTWPISRRCRTCLRHPETRLIYLKFQIPLSGYLLANLLNTVIIAYCHSYNIQLVIQKKYFKMIWYCDKISYCDTFDILQQCHNIQLSLYQFRLHSYRCVLGADEHVDPLSRVLRPTFNGSEEIWWPLMVELIQRWRW